MADWGKWGDALYDGAGDLVDKGKEIVGTGIDKGSDVLGSGLEKVGADEWADKVEDWGDETASSLGADVGEQQLGQSEEANELIHGQAGEDQCGGEEPPGLPTRVRSRRRRDEEARFRSLEG